MSIKNTWLKNDIVTFKGEDTELWRVIATEEDYFGVDTVYLKICKGNKVISLVDDRNMKLLQRDSTQARLY